MRASGRRRSWTAPFVSDLGRAEIGQEILAGVMGWQTVVISLEFCEYRMQGIMAQMNTWYEYEYLFGVSSAPV